jgi:hypothetical protein
VDAGVFSALVAMVMATTLVTPPALQWSLRRARRRAPPGEALGARGSRREPDAVAVRERPGTDPDPRAG